MATTIKTIQVILWFPFIVIGFIGAFIWDGLHAGKRTHDTLIEWLGSKQ